MAVPKEVNLPEQPRIKQVDVTPVKSIVLEDLDAIQSFVIKDDKIYTVSALSKLFAIYDLEGNVVKIYERSGQGPGEFGLPSICYYDKPQNGISVVDNMNQKELLFDFNGNFVKETKFNPMNTPMSRYYVNDQQFKWSNQVIVDQAAGKVLVEPTIAKIDGDSEKVIFQTSFNPVRISMSTMGMPIITGNQRNLYISSYDIENYQVKRYNAEGDVDLIINKKYSKVERPKEEVTELKNKIDQYVKQAAQGFKVETTGFEFEYAIDFLFSDDANLYVVTHDQHGSLIDVISQKGVIKKQLRKEKDFGSCQVYDGRIYELETNAEEDIILNVYDL
jgi:hypothetical protein